MAATSRPGPSPPSASSPGSAKRWTLHRDTAGFRLRAPQGWCVSASGDGEFSVCERPDGAIARVRLCHMPPLVDLAQWLVRDHTEADPGLYRVRVRSLRSCGAQAAMLAFDYGSAVFQGRAVTVALRHSDKARLYIAAAPRESFAQRLPELASILASVRFGRPAGSSQAGPEKADPFPRIDLRRLLLVSVRDGLSVVLP